MAVDAADVVKQQNNKITNSHAGVVFLLASSFVTEPKRRVRVRRPLFHVAMKYKFATGFCETRSGKGQTSRWVTSAEVHPSSHRQAVDFARTHCGRGSARIES